MAIVHFSRFWCDLESDIILAFNANNRQKKNWCIMVSMWTHTAIINTPPANVERKTEKLVDEEIQCLWPKMERCN